MDAELYDELTEGMAPSGVDAIEHAQKCMHIYQQTLQAMGHYPIEYLSSTVENSKLSYKEQKEPQENYANLSTDY